MKSRRIPRQPLPPPNRGDGKGATTMKRSPRRFKLASETLRVLDPQDLKKAAGDSLVTTTTQIQSCHCSILPTLCT
jgi:hypothetical protein